MKVTYRAVVESGSCSVDRKFWEERATCGHNHKTVEAAEKCLDKKRRGWCIHNRLTGLPCRFCNGGIAHNDHMSAFWYNGRIHNNNEERV